ncbi:stage III sporulation protein AF [Virgibacillus profundi]|uniref:Stage III sporulation protein AF n=1 Tax=Virgibacillus profundi TaxID=2024555 RepID=A0A2A2ID87_9BACI|nr:stage III sporulation protein AF [Virgibacillus profundi]PAV29100.1 stage III sporulation protein AF [Virgibacillus profundi]PXY53269.1 stage III sporulation protein AF [Virgibacillus profundi]
MDMLIDWVTQIIIFLLLAAIIDLLIPATTMKKYIKLVVGLILILILLKPIFFILNIDIERALETSYSQLRQEGTNNESIENLIELQKSEIQDSQDAYKLEQTAVHLKDLAKDALVEDHQAEIIDIKFIFETEKDVGFESLEKVVVYLRELDDGEGAVSIVDDVVINTDDPVVDEEGQDDEQIEELLRNVWELRNKELTISWEGGTS